MKFIPFFVGIFFGLISTCFIILPVTQTELHLWNILQVRKLRHWVTKKKTERWNFEKGKYSVIEISRKNIRWHILLTFTFSFLMLKAQYTTNSLQVVSHFLLIPIIGYFIGSIIQRQKIAILVNRKN